MPLRLRLSGIFTGIAAKIYPGVGVSGQPISLLSDDEEEARFLTPSEDDIIRFKRRVSQGSDSEAPPRKKSREETREEVDDEKVIYIADKTRCGYAILYT